MFLMRILLVTSILSITGLTHAQTSTTADSITMTPIAQNLNNPRGVAFLPDGRLLLAEAGIGDDEPGLAVGTGQITLMEDLNGDGDYDDDGERRAIVTNIPSYNSLGNFRTGHDEPFGAGDIVVLPDGRIFYTQDDPFAQFANPGEEGFIGDVGLFVVNDDMSGAERFVKRIATVNALTYHPEREMFYITESGFNRIVAISLTGGEDSAEVVLPIPNLASNQQPVPSGIAYDPTTGDILVALLSGYIHDYREDESMSYMPGDAKILRFDPETGEATDAITGLTTAIDVTVDEVGNIYTVELTTGWPLALMPDDFDLYDPAGVPDPGGYVRDSGRVMRYPADGSDPVVLASGLDTPTNITYHDGRLYVSTGLGTPGRRALRPDGSIRPIEGVLYVITGF